MWNKSRGYYRRNRSTSGCAAIVPEDRVKQALVYGADEKVACKTWWVVAYGYWVYESTVN